MALPPDLQDLEDDREEQAAGVQAPPGHEPTLHVLVEGVHAIEEDRPDLVLGNPVAFLREVLPVDFHRHVVQEPPNLPPEFPQIAKADARSAGPAR